MPKIKLAVVGSRSFNDYSFLCEKLKQFDISEIISGGAKGADELAKQYAKENNINYREFLPDWENYGKSAGYRRNSLIINDSNEVVAFWNGESKGTKHSIELAEKQNKKVHIYWPENDMNFDDIG